MYFKLVWLRKHSQKRMEIAVSFKKKNYTALTYLDGLEGMVMKTVILINLPQLEV